MITEIKMPPELNINEFSAAVRFINADAVMRVEGRPNYRAMWDTDVAAVPPARDIIAAAVAWMNRKSARETEDNESRQALMNNVDLINQATISIAQARAALDTAIPLDTSSQQATIDSLAQRQAAVLHLSANALRAAMVLAKRGSLPGEIVNAFLR